MDDIPPLDAKEKLQDILQECRFIEMPPKWINVISDAVDYITYIEAQLSTRHDLQKTRL